LHLSRFVTTKARGRKKTDEVAAADLATAGSVTADYISIAMQGKGPTIPVRLNRRVLLRPLAMMAGDNLVDIRKATRDNRAEFRNGVKVYNGSVAAVMNRELGIQYRELAFRVSTFRRKQHTMYKTMCQVR